MCATPFLPPLPAGGGAGGAATGAPGAGATEHPDELPDYVGPGTGRLYEAREEDPVHPAPEPLRERLRSRRPYWFAAMRVLGTVCALTMSILDAGYALDWAPDKGPPAAVNLPNTRLAFANREFVSAAIAEGVAAGTMVPCSSADLHCVLPLSVAFNSIGKRRLIWDGRHVNEHLPKVPFRMETLQREGRVLFAGAGWGGTADISSAYHHIPMHKDSTRYLGFEWDGQFFFFAVLPFGLSTAPWVFTTVMSTCIRFLRMKGVRLMVFLDDLIFAHISAREALSAAQLMLHILPRFGWLLHPTKCQGVAAAIQRFTALGTVVCLASQTYSVPAATVDRITRLGSELLGAGPACRARALARLRGLVASTWVSTGSASRLRVRAMTAVIESRPLRTRRGSWGQLVRLSDECVAEIRWWIANLVRVGRSPISPRPADGLLDGFIFSDASDSGVGAVLFAEGPEAAASSLVAALRSVAPAGMSASEVSRYAQRGIEFVAPLPPILLEASSTLRELFGVWRFLHAVRRLLRGGRHLLVMDNLGCVFILGGAVPAFARGGRPWGEFLSGGSPNPELQRLAIAIADLQDEGDFSLVPVWRPREENVRADFLSRVSQLQLHDYRLRPGVFAALDALWGPHTIDRFATIDSCQPLQGRFAGRFCSLFFHPAAVWSDAFAAPWGSENNWVFPPFPLAGAAAAAIRTQGVRATLIVIEDRSAAWWPTLRSGQGWARDIRATRTLGPVSRVISHLSASHEGVSGDPLVLALRFDGRGSTLPHRTA